MCRPLIGEIDILSYMLTSSKVNCGSSGQLGRHQLHVLLTLRLFTLVVLFLLILLCFDIVSYQEDSWDMLRLHVILQKHIEGSIRAPGCNKQTSSKRWQNQKNTDTVGELWKSCLLLLLSIFIFIIILISLLVLMQTASYSCALHQAKDCVSGGSKPYKIIEVGHWNSWNSYGMLRHSCKLHRRPHSCRQDFLAACLVPAKGKWFIMIYHMEDFQVPKS